jgi:uncharacterized protein involved in cysteine biosynthesis
MELLQSNVRGLNSSRSVRDLTITQKKSGSLVLTLIWIWASYYTAPVVVGISSAGWRYGGQQDWLRPPVQNRKKSFHWHEGWKMQSKKTHFSFSCVSLINLRIGVWKSRAMLVGVCSSGKTWQSCDGSFRGQAAVSPWALRWEACWGAGCTRLRTKTSWRHLSIS